MIVLRHEIWFGATLADSGLPINWCTAFVHLVEEIRKALDDCPQKYVLLGHVPYLTSSMNLENVVHGVSHEDESCVISMPHLRSESKAWNKSIESEARYMSERKI